MTGPVDWRSAFEAHLNTLRGIAFNRLAAGRDREALEEAIAETIALSWKFWLAAIARGRDPRAFSTILAKQTVASVQAGLTLSGGNRLTEALSTASRCKNGYHVESLDNVECSSNGHLENAFVTGPGADPGNAARAHLDWLEWSGRLCPRLYGVLVELLDGASVREVAKRRGWTREYAHRVRTRLARSWQAFGVDCE